MKVVVKNDEELIVSDGSRKRNVVMGVVFITLGAGAGYYLYSVGRIDIALLPIFLVIFGFILILSASDETFDVNKVAGKIELKKNSIFGGHSASYAISDVTKIEIRREWSETLQAGNAYKGYQLMVQPILIFKTQELPLGFKSFSSRFSTPIAPLTTKSMVQSTVLTSGQERIFEDWQPVASFLNIPIEQIDPDTNPWVTEK